MICSGKRFNSSYDIHGNGLAIDCAAVSSDRRLNHNEQLFINALDVVNRIETVEYDQTYSLLDQYTTDASQSHQCGLIAPSLQQFEALMHVVVAGDMGEDGQETS